MGDKISARRAETQIYLWFSEPQPNLKLCEVWIKGTTNREENKIKLFIFYPKSQCAFTMKSLKLVRPPPPN